MEGYKWHENRTKREMQRFLSEIFLDYCQMIVKCSVNGSVDFLRSQSKFVYHYISHERLLNVYFWQIHPKKTKIPFSFFQM